MNRRALLEAALLLWAQSAPAGRGRPVRFYLDDIRFE